MDPLPNPEVLFRRLCVHELCYAVRGSCDINGFCIGSAFEGADVDLGRVIWVPHSQRISTLTGIQSNTDEFIQEINRGCQAVKRSLDINKLVGAAVPSSLPDWEVQCVVCKEKKLTTDELDIRPPYVQEVFFETARRTLQMLSVFTESRAQRLALVQPTSSSQHPLQLVL